MVTASAKILAYLRAKSKLGQVTHNYELRDLSLSHRDSILFLRKKGIEILTTQYGNGKYHYIITKDNPEVVIRNGYVIMLEPIEIFETNVKNDVNKVWSFLTSFL